MGQTLTPMVQTQGTKSPLQDKYKDLINQQMGVLNDPAKAGEWRNRMRSTIGATILGQENLKPHLLQGPGAQINTGGIQGVKVSPEALAKRQQLLQGNRDAMSRQFVAQNQMQDDALRRRFAQLGNAGSGAALKAQLEAQRSLGESQADQERQLAGQELQAQQAFEEAQAGRDQQAQALKAQYDAQNVQNQLSREMFNTELSNKMDEYNQQYELQRVKDLYDMDTTEFNRGIAQLSVGGGK